MTFSVDARASCALQTKICSCDSLGELNYNSISDGVCWLIHKKGSGGVSLHSTRLDPPVAQRESNIVKHVGDLKTTFRHTNDSLLGIYICNQTQPIFLINRLFYNIFK